MFNESRTRSIVKALTWQLLGLVSMTLIALVFTGDIRASGGLALASAATGFLCFFLHERIWARIPWGRGVLPQQGETLSRPRRPAE